MNEPEFLEDIGPLEFKPNSTYVFKMVSPEYLDELLAKAEENKKLREVLNWLLHLAHGVSKGGGEPASAEWEEAWEIAKELMDKDDES